MKLIALILLLVSVVAANVVKFDSRDHSQVCAGMYSKHDWGGSIQPRITIKLTEFDDLKFDGKDEHDIDKIDVSYIIFEYKDLVNIGTPIDEYHKQYICDDAAINDLQVCTEKQKGRFIIGHNVTNSTIMTSQLAHMGFAHINYKVDTTGYYCVTTASLSDKPYAGEINFQNAFGYLPASEIPKLPAYGILTLCYAISLALFGFQFFKKRKQHQILPLQRYLLAFTGFLTFDTIVVWSYYDLLNRTKSPTSGFNIFYMIFLSLLNAIKITFAFFLLLCIALGYGVVLMKLPKDIMFKCKILAGLQFVTSLVYLLWQYYTSNILATTTSSELGNDSVGGILGLIPTLPVTITSAAYYLAILVSIKNTTAKLHKQRQVIKLQLYENLFRIIFFSVILTFGGLIASSSIYLTMSTTQMMEEHWKSAFFLYDFWPSVAFFVVFIGVAWLWRPTETSYMLAISQQVSTEESGEGDQGHEFELDDMSLMSHDDDENFQHTRDDIDDLDLTRSPQNKDLPPDYEQINDSQQENEENNTLFELGDDESDQEDNKDTRLKKPT